MKIEEMNLEKKKKNYTFSLHVLKYNEKKKPLQRFVDLTKIIINA